MLTTRYDIRLPFYLFIATVSSYLISLFLLQLFAGLLVLAWLFESNKNKLKGLDKLSYLFITFVFIRLLSSIFSNYPDSSNQMFYKDALFFLSFFAFGYYLKVFDENKIKTIFYAFTIAAVIVAVIGIVRFLVGSVERAQSFSSGYSTYSSYLVSSLGLILIAFKLVKDRKQKIFISVGIVLIISGIVTSLGRTNILIAFIIFIIGTFAIKIKMKYVAAFIILAIGISWLSFQINVKEINQRINTPVQLSDRDILLETAKELVLKFEEPIIGYGPRTFHDVFSNKEKLSDKGVGSWHNDFIQVYFESGILGLLAFLTIILFPFIKGVKCLNGCHFTETNKLILIGALLGVTALVLSALTAGFINSPVLAVLFAFLITIVSATIYPVRSNNK